jgi:hypothetical protein
MKFVKSFLLFENNNINELKIIEKLNSSWKIYDKSEKVTRWITPLSKKGFYCIIEHVEDDIGARYFNFYLKDIFGDINFMDHLPTGSIIYKKKFIDIEDALDICEDQLNYYNNIEKFPTKKEIKECLYPFTDNEFYLESDIFYGYKNPYGSEYFIVDYHNTETADKFCCAFILKINSSEKVSALHKFKEYLNNFKMEIQDLNEYEYEVEVHPDYRGIIFYISLKSLLTP